MSYDFEMAQQTVELKDGVADQKGVELRDGESELLDDMGLYRRISCCRGEGRLLI